MKLVPNVGHERVHDLTERALVPGASLDVLSPTFSVFAYAALARSLRHVQRARWVLPAGMDDAGELALVGNLGDRTVRNRLDAGGHARACMAWMEKRAEVRSATGPIPQGALVVRDRAGAPVQAVTGAVGWSTAGLGLAPGNRLDLVQASETPAEAELLARWFDAQWGALRPDPGALSSLLNTLSTIAHPRPPADAYALVLHHLFGARTDALDEEQVLRSGTGIRNTVVWNKLYRFQRDGVLGILDKLQRYGGCILADSVGLGKTFEALAVIKYHELRNDRVLVLCPKRLRDNWTVFKANDRRNVLAADRFHYDVLNHTDLSREDGLSGDVDLAHVNWGNYDLVVIDESHNFRNKRSPRADGETRYDRLMRRIVREGVKTRVLMLSATPVNNRLADLRNQIAFATEGEDTALAAHGIASIDSTTRVAQVQFNKWLKLPEGERTASKLLDMLGFDYFALLDLLTIARSRKHIEKYYGTEETGRFPERLKPINLRPNVDSAGSFRSVREINLEIRKLTLAAYAPLRYVRGDKQAAYDEKYSTKVRGGAGVFRQADREESLVHLLRVNVLKRMESAVTSFAQTLERQLHDVEKLLTRIAAHDDTVEAPDIAELNLDDPTVETLLVGKKVRVLLGDVDLLRWRQDLSEDRNRLAALLEMARQVGSARDAKLAALKHMLRGKCASPINPGNRKVIVFTAFADTAAYLYGELAGWARAELGIETALVTGTGGNQCSLPNLKKDLGTLLSAFSPRAKARPPELAGEGELDLLIATDCISEGQNLQDCDWLVNYDIHWNPVRIIQRFGRIDRLGSTNTRIQLVNFWPNVELEEYIGLESRVTGKMVLLDISATGEENLIGEADNDAEMNDLAYRRKQLLQLQDAVVDLEDLSAGVSISDMTLTDFRVDLAQLGRARTEALARLPIGAWTVTATRDADIAPGMIFCLRAEGETARRLAGDGYPLAPVFLVHVGETGADVVPYTQARRILDALKRTCVGRDSVDEGAARRFDARTRDGMDMRQAQDLLAAAVGSLTGKAEERAVESLFSPEGSHTLRGEFAGIEDIEVLAWIALLGPDA